MDVSVELFRWISLEVEIFMRSCRRNCLASTLASLVRGCSDGVVMNSREMNRGGVADLCVCEWLCYG